MKVEPSSYEALYHLQDRCLAQIFAEPAGFYLGGGTALSRFYLKHRFSDDLDLFVHEPHLFPEYFRRATARLTPIYPELQVDVDARDFKRVVIREASQTLKIDFVADRVPRVGLTEQRGGIVIDCVRNILANKLTAVLDRDEGRDIIDILSIAKHYRFNWKQALTDAQQKAMLTAEDIAYRLKTFPPAIIDEVPFAEAPVAIDVQQALSTLAHELQEGSENSLCGPDAEALMSDSR